MASLSTPIHPIGDDKTALGIHPLTVPRRDVHDHLKSVGTTPLAPTICSILVAEWGAGRSRRNVHLAPTYLNVPLLSRNRSRPMFPSGPPPGPAEGVNHVRFQA